MRMDSFICQQHAIHNTLNYVYEKKLVQRHCCELRYLNCFGRCTLNTTTSHIRMRILLSFLLSVTLLVISSSCLKPVTALEYAKPFGIVDDIEKDSSAEYDDYVDNNEPSTEAVETMRQENYTYSYANQTQNQTERIQTNENIADEEKHPSEIQKAVCTITAGEVRASAEAVTTKTLKGVCGSAELQAAVSNLESKIFTELAAIKALLLQQIAAKQENMQQPTNCDCSYVHETKTVNPSTTKISLLKPIITEKLTKPSPKLKSLHHNQQEMQSQSQSQQSRDKEVSKFNNTMLADKDVKVFTYYWRLENFTARIESGNSVNMESPRFAIKGKLLHLRAYFQHLHRDFLYIQLVYANSAQMMKSNVPNRSGSSNNIILDMGLLGGGSLFKAISSNEQILFKYKISILDQQNLRSTKDLVSQEFHNLEGGFLVPNSALLGSSYIKNDTLLIQLFLYL